MRDYGLTRKLHRRLRVLKSRVEKSTDVIDLLDSEPPASPCGEEALKDMPALAAFSLIHWALEGKHQGHGYGFPCDRPYLVLTQRVKRVSTELEHLRTSHLRHNDSDNRPLHNTFRELSMVMNDTGLWDSVARLESDIQVFDTLREALRIAPKTSQKGLNDNGSPAEMTTIKEAVETFTHTIIHSEGYSENIRYQNMITQIEKYWHKLFADPTDVDTPNGPLSIRPQRTNNLAEHHFREMTRGYRQKTGKGALGKTLRTMLANTPLVKNLHNAESMTILLHGTSNLAELFAEIESTEVRHEMKKSQEYVEKIPARLKKMTNKATFPEVLRNCFAKLQSNGILR